MKLKSPFLAAVLAIFSASTIHAKDMPNILWITSEDNGPQLGCYGDEYAVTPNLDQLATRGIRYLRASSNAPVCAPARTTVISGVYPPSTGAEHMRSMLKLPDTMQMFPVYLRQLGYYCTNQSKEDYNLEKTGEVWDDSGKKAHWNKRDGDQPFFAVFNETISHESKIRNEIDPKLQIHDPAKARVPAYHPDTPEVRRDWAQYYDRVTEMDTKLGARLKEIEEAGLADDTIILYWGDHGSGMPRHKRWPYNSGLHVPMIVHFPAKWQHLAPEEYKVGGTSDRMVGFVDLAPTMLSLVGLEPESWMQGHAFAGKFETKSPEFSFGFRGRMDERVDLVRTVMGPRYVYIRQYMPHRIYGQYISYMFQTKTTKQWHDMFHAGELNEAQSHFWREKPAEELYDLQTDPDEVKNLAGSPEHKEILETMRAAHVAWEKEIVDVGFLPEAEVHSRSGNRTPYEMARSEAYDFDAVFAAAQLASSKKVEDILDITDLFASEDSGVRYWGATGLLIHGEEGYTAGREKLVAALDDESAPVAIVAAEVLGRFGDKAEQEQAVQLLLSHANQVEGDLFEAILAVNAIDYLDDIAASAKEAIYALPDVPGKEDQRLKNYVGNLLKKIREDLGE